MVMANGSQVPHHSGPLTFDVDTSCGHTHTSLQCASEHKPLEKLAPSSPADLLSDASSLSTESMQTKSSGL